MIHDTLAYRHGGLISHGWRVIEAARKAVRRDDPPGGQLRRLQTIRRRIVKAHEAELLRGDLPTSEIDGWFREIEEVLVKAEAHFRAQALPLSQRAGPPASAPPALYPMASAVHIPAQN